MGKSALMIWGGWEGHTPRETTELLAANLTEKGYTVRIESSLAALEDKAALKTFDLISPCWTMGEMTDAQFSNLSEAVQAGVGFAGIHGGAGDAFRGRVEYQWMVGGQFLGHPHVGPYSVSLTPLAHPITDDMPASFEYTSEQYYMQVDPSIRILAETMYVYDGVRVRMPVVWTKTWGAGRVFYSALGHSADELVSNPKVVDMTIRGFQWATR